MEPIKGGALANPIQKVQDVFKEAAPEMSFDKPDRPLCRVLGRHYYGAVRHERYRADVGQSFLYEGLQAS